MNANSPGDRFDLAVLLDEQTLVLLGHCTAPLPARAVVRFAEGATEGIFRAVNWTAADGGRALAVIRADGLALVRPADMTLVAEDGTTRPMPPVARVELGAAAVWSALQSTASAVRAAAFDFLLGAVLDTEFGTPSARARSFVHAFLRETSEQGGFIVISHDNDLLAQTVNKVFHLDGNREVIDIYNMPWKQYLIQRETDEARRTPGSVANCGCIVRVSQSVIAGTSRSVEVKLR